MISRCANPACHLPFDYREGRLFRFHKAHLPGERPPNTHSVQHFWLCASCAAHFTLLYSEEAGVFLEDRAEISAAPQHSCFISAA